MRRCRAQYLAMEVARRGYAAQVKGMPPDRYIVIIRDNKQSKELIRFVDVWLADRWLKEHAR